jgi:hypothetical protein
MISDASMTFIPQQWKSERPSDSRTEFRAVRRFQRTMIIHQRPFGTLISNSAILGQYRTSDSASIISGSILREITCRSAQD